MGRPYRMNDGQKMITWPSKMPRRFGMAVLIFKGQMKEFSIDVLTYGDVGTAFPDDAASHPGRMECLATHRELGTRRGTCSVELDCIGR